MEGGSGGQGIKWKRRRKKREIEGGKAYDGLGLKEKRGGRREG